MELIGQSDDDMNHPGGVYPGLNVQWPWSRLIIEGKKTVETRNYPLPIKYLRAPLALIETPGRKSESRLMCAQIIGLIWFSDSFEYSNKSEWLQDSLRHCVPYDHSTFSYSEGRKKFGWILGKVLPFQSPIAAPARRGIVFATSCEVSF